MAAHRHEGTETNKDRVMICIDLSRLYFAIRNLGVTINYEKLVNVLLKNCESGDTEETIEAFTKADPKNKNQNRFLERLEGLGINLRVYDASTSISSFSMEITAVAALSGDESITILSNDG